MPLLNTKIQLSKKFEHLNGYTSTHSQGCEHHIQSTCSYAFVAQGIIPDCLLLCSKPSHSHLMAHASTFLPHTRTLPNFIFLWMNTIMGLSTQLFIQLCPRDGLSGPKLALCSADKFGQWSCYSLHPKQHEFLLHMNKTDFFFSACHLWPASIWSHSTMTTLTNTSF